MPPTAFASLALFFNLTAAATVSASDLLPELEALRAKHNVPALGAAAVRDGQVVFSGVTGVRLVGEKAPVTNNDLWHLGSCTKSITATLAGVLVDEKKIRWDSKIGEVLPDMRTLLRGGWENVTLEQLLTNRSGAPNEPPTDAWAQAWQMRGAEVTQRTQFVRGFLARPPEAAPGTQTIYSNQGFTLAGLMLERAAKQPFNELMRAKVFAPLGMKSAGFGGPGERQPRGHTGEGTTLKPVAPDADNPPAITPAGRVHCSLADFARYASWHARGPLHDVKLMSEATFQKLHMPPTGSDYAMGWKVYERPWAGGTALAHNGSNTYWLATVWVAPATRSAYVAVTNCAGKNADEANDAAIGLLLEAK